MLNITVGNFATNCWIYPLDMPSLKGADCDSGQPAKPSPCAVIDPGDEGNRIIALLDQHNLSPVYILLTHGHFDHIGALPILAAQYRDVIIAIHAADAEYLGPNCGPVHCRSLGYVLGDTDLATMYIGTAWENMPSPDWLLAEGDTIGPFTVLHLPGHTPGSIGLWDQKAGILFSGDTLFHGGYGRTDLPGGDEKQLFASLNRLFDMDAPSCEGSPSGKDGDIQVYPGHGPVTSRQTEKGFFT
jgi:glyoxylase-like metal-dependent hydrolase (beta-lactamase superfamily II)